MKYIKAVIALFVFFFASVLDIIPVTLFNIELNDQNSIILSLCRNILISIILFFIYRKEIILEYHKFRENSFQNLDTGFKYWLIGLALMMISNILIQTLFPNSVAGNEESVQSMISVLPLFMFINTSILAPINEEICFRKTFYDTIKNKILFIIISGIFFGSLHVVFAFENLVDLLYIIPYSCLGIAFAFMYFKTETVFTSIIMHAIHNGILTLLSIYSMSMFIF